VHVACGRGFVLLWWCYNILCTSIFVDDVIFSYNGPYDIMTLLPQPCRSVHANTPVAWYWLLSRRQQVPRLDKPFVWGAQYATHFWFPILYRLCLYVHCFMDLQQKRWKNGTEKQKLLGRECWLIYRCCMPLQNKNMLLYYKWAVSMFIILTFKSVAVDYRTNSNVNILRLLSAHL